MEDVTSDQAPNSPGAPEIGSKSTDSTIGATNLHTGVSGPVIVQGSSLPVFHAGGGSDLRCTCGQILVAGFEPRRLVAIAIECFSCKQITKLDAWPNGEPLPQVPVSMGSQGRFLVGGTVDLRGKDVVITTDQEIERVKAAVGAAPPSEVPIKLSQGGLTRIKVELNLMSDNALAKALGKTRSAIEKGNRKFFKYPVAWAILQLQRGIERGVIDLDDQDDLDALSLLTLLLHVIERWKHHPLFPSLGKGLVYEVNHFLTMLLAASYLSDHGNRVGFTDTSMQSGKSPDLYVNGSPDSRLSIEVKAPPSLQWSSPVPSVTTIEKTIEEQARTAKKQLTGAAGGILVVGALHPGITKDAIETALLELVAEGRFSQRIAAVVVVLLSAAWIRQQNGKTTSGGGGEIVMRLNPRFGPTNPVRMDSRPGWPGGGRL